MNPLFWNSSVHFFMKESKQILPGISKIGYIDCRHLAKYVALQHICGMKVSVLTDITFISQFEEASCECQNKLNNGILTSTATLSFRTNKVIPDNGYLAFVVITPQGDAFLVGSKEAPRPVIEYDYSAGMPGSTPAGFNYEIKHVAIRSMIPCVIEF